MSGRVHTRSGRLPAHARPSRPTLLTKRTASHSNNPHGHTAAVSPTSRPSSSCKAAGSGDEGDLDDDDDDDAMASFLQFCPTCEKQIVNPSISVLYCSEACRRRDSLKSTPLTLQYASPPLSPTTPAYRDYPPTTIIPRWSPTVLRPLSATLSELSLCELSSASASPTDDNGYSIPEPYRAARPHTARASATDDSANLPSLIHSPASSYDTVASTTSASTRPLPPKRSTTTTRSIDLVTPDVSARPTAPAAATAAAAAASSLESSTSTLTASPIRKPTAATDGRRGKAYRSLQMLFQHDSVKVAPVRVARAEVSTGAGLKGSLSWAHREL